MENSYLPNCIIDHVLQVILSILVAFVLLKNFLQCSVVDPEGLRGVLNSFSKTKLIKISKIAVFGT